jgi:hypothetical protein
LYGCETLTLTLREEYSLNVLEKGVMRRTFSPKPEEATRGCRKLQRENTELITATTSVSNTFRYDVYSCVNNLYWFTV